MIFPKKLTDDNLEKWQEIAEAVEVHQDTVSGWTKDFTEKLATDNSVKSRMSRKRRSEKKRFCYRGSNLCYGVIIILCYGIAKTGSNHTPGIATQLIEPTVSKWLSRTLKEEKERKKDAAFGMWLACHTQEEIAAAVDMTQPVITGWQDDFINKCQEHDFIKSSDFEVPLYNVWKQQNKSNAVNHFGNSEPRWLDNLLIRLKVKDVAEQVF